MKSVGISRPYLIAPWTRSRIIAERSISLSGLPRYFSASIDDLGAVLAHVDLLRRPADRVERVGDAVASLRTAATIRSIVRSRSSGERRPTMPRSMRPMTGGTSPVPPMMMMLPGCGSAWKKPSSKIILMTTPTASSRPWAVQRRRRDLVDLLAVEELEREHLLARRLLVDLRKTHGSPCGVPSKFLVKRSVLLAPRLKLSSAVIDAIELLHEPDRRVDARLRDRALDRRGHDVEELEVSLRRCADVRALHLHDDRLARLPASRGPRGAPGRSTRWRAASRRTRETSASGAPRLDSTTCLISSNGTAGTSSWSFLSSAITSGGRTSFRVETICRA